MLRTFLVAAFPHNFSFTSWPSSLAPTSSQPRSLTLIFPNRRHFLLLHTVIPDHPSVLPDIVTLDLQAGLWLDSLEQEVIVAVRAVFVALLKSLHVLAEAFLAFLAGKNHLGGAFELMVVLFGMAFGAVEPLPAAGSADGHLGVENVFTGRDVRRM